MHVVRKTTQGKILGTEDPQWSEFRTRLTSLSEGIGPPGADTGCDAETTRHAEAILAAMGFDPAATFEAWRRDHVFDCDCEIIYNMRPTPGSLLSECGHNYRVTDNPLYVWDAILKAEQAKVDLPSWVVEYLRSVACGLMRIQECVEHHDDCAQTRRNRPAAVIEALGLRAPGAGRKTDAFEAIAVSRDERIAYHVALLRKTKRLTYEAARDVAMDRYAVSRSVVDRAWRDLRPQRAAPGKLDKQSHK